MEVTPWLNLEGRFGIDNYNDDNVSRNSPVDAEKLVGGRYSHTLARNRIQNHLAMARINQTFGEKP